MSQEVPESPHIAAIRRRMAQVRRGLDEDVQDIVEVARDMGKWRYYVRAFPWLFLGAAVVGGYLLVPRKRVPSQLRRALIRREESEQQIHNGATQGQVPDSPSPARTSNISSLRGTALRFAGNLLMRSALTHAARQVDKLLAPSPLEPAGRNESDERIRETTR